jgi:hypothetical protein
MPAVKITPQVDLRGQFGRRQGSQAETVLAPIVVEGEIHGFENQRRRLSRWRPPRPPSRR